MKHFIFCSIIVASIALCVFIFYPGKTEGLHVTFFDIGQGDATFIEFPNGEQMLVDCSKDARVLESLGRAMPFYDKTIDYLIVTHPDLDHYGGCTDVLKRFDVAHVVYNGAQKDDAFWRETWKEIQEEEAGHLQMSEYQEWTIADTTLTFFYPDHDVSINPAIPEIGITDESNNAGIVFSVSFVGKKILFMADAGVDLETYLIKIYGGNLDADVLKIGHHGSNGSTGQAFLDAVTPSHAVISSGKGNSYGHPALRIVRRLERSGVQIWRTDTVGDVALTIGTDGSLFIE